MALERERALISRGFATPRATAALCRTLPTPCSAQGEGGTLVKAASSYTSTQGQGGGLVTSAQGDGGVSLVPRPPLPCTPLYHT